MCPIIPRRHYLREPQRLPRPVQEGALGAFFAAIEAEPVLCTRDRAMFLLMLRCGLRIGEVAGLLLADLYLDEPTAPAGAGKGTRERVVYLSHQAERALRRYLAETLAAESKACSSATSCGACPPPPSTTGWPVTGNRRVRLTPTACAIASPTTCSRPIRP